MPKIDYVAGMIPRDVLKSLENGSVNRIKPDNPFVRPITPAKSTADRPAFLEYLRKIRHPSVSPKPTDSTNLPLFETCNDVGLISNGYEPQEFPQCRAEALRLEYEQQTTDDDQYTWIKWEGGNMPVAAFEIVHIKFGAGPLGQSRYASDFRWHAQGLAGDIKAYRLANRTPRNVAPLAVDHPHYALQRLWASDETLKAWIWDSFANLWICIEDREPSWIMDCKYHVGHVAPKKDTK